MSKKYVSKELSEQIHKKAEPFLTWLKEAEEESDESDEEGLDLTFDEKAKISTIKEVEDNKNTNGKESTPISNKDDDEGDDDLDIDDI